VFDNDYETQYNLIQHYPLFTKRQIKSSIDEYIDLLYDKFDKRNLTDSCEFLLNSIDSTIQQQINSFLLSTTSGPEVWMSIRGSKFLC
jgi:hypothetical protein